MSENKSSGSVGVLGLLGVLFVALKLTGYIDWSWIWVTAPFWGTFALLFIIIILAGVGVISANLYMWVERKLTKKKIKRK
jgi:hypothetical protein